MFSVHCLWDGKIVQVASGYKTFKTAQRMCLMKAKDLPGRDMHVRENGVLVVTPEFLANALGETATD